MSQISLDIVNKFNQAQKKESISEKEMEDGEDDSLEKEKEGDSEEDFKTINENYLLTLLEEKNSTTLYKQQEFFNIPKGLHKTFTPPPDLAI